MTLSHAACENCDGQWQPKIVSDTMSETDTLTPCYEHTAVVYCDIWVNQRRPLLCESVHLAVRNKSGADQELDAFVVPHISDPITSQMISSCSEMYAHNTGLDLADLPPDEPLEVDMLIWSDFYWDFITG